MRNGIEESIVQAISQCSEYQKEDAIELSKAYAKFTEALVEALMFGSCCSMELLDKLEIAWRNFFEALYKFNNHCPLKDYVENK